MLYDTVKAFTGKIFVQVDFAGGYNWVQVVKADLLQLLMFCDAAGLKCRDEGRYMYVGKDA